MEDNELSVSFMRMFVSPVCTSVGRIPCIWNYCKVVVATISRNRNDNRLLVWRNYCPWRNRLRPYIALVGAFLQWTPCIKSPSWESGTRTVDQEILRLLWNMKVLYCVDNSRTFPEAAEYIPNRILSFIVRSSNYSLAIFGLKFSRYFVYHV
jgi:hypothetical protein